MPVNKADKIENGKMLVIVKPYTAFKDNSSKAIVNITHNRQDGQPVPKGMLLIMERVGRLKQLRNHFHQSSQHPIFKPQINNK